MSAIPKKTEERDHAQKISENNIEIEEYQKRLELLYEVAQQANSVEEVSDLLERILNVTQHVLNASASSLLLINENKGEFHLQAAGGEKSNILKQIDLDLKAGIIGWVARNGKPVVANDVSQDKRFNKEVDETTGFVTKAIMAAPIVRGRKVIGVIEIINKIDGGIFNDRDLAVLTGFASTEALTLLVSMAATAINNIKLCQAIQVDYKSTIETLVTAADGKDPYASGHSRRVRDYALLAADFLDFSVDELQVIEIGALLHDIGKIGISDSILRKAGPLTPEEWYIMRKHCLRGANIVSEIPTLRKARDIILHHHEKYDGTGYPNGLKGEKIPIGACLVAVADAFDTMITEHSYRPALSIDEAMSELIKNNGTQFSPIAVEAFVSAFQKHKGKLFIKQAEQAAREQAERETREKIEQEARKKAEREAKEKAEQEAREKAEQEAREKAEREARKKAERESKEKAEREAKEKAEREAKEKAKREARERAEREAKEKAEKEAKEKAEKEVKKKTERIKDTEEAVQPNKSELYEGDVNLMIDSSAGFEEANQFKKSLRTVEDLKIGMQSWSEDKGTIIVVSLQKPMALGKILSKFPAVEQLYQKNGDILVVLKTSETS